MFKLRIKRLPWRGREVAAKMEATGVAGARAAAEFVAERARIYAPVDTGELQASIKVTSSRGGAVWNVLATAPHARWVEWGSMHGGTFIRPNPFMRRAMQDGRKAFPQFLREAMVRAMPGTHLGATSHV